jgi:hypothetical protein
MEWLEGAWAARPVAEVGCQTGGLPDRWRKWAARPVAEVGCYGEVLDLGELSDPRVRGCNGGATCPWRLDEQRCGGNCSSRRPDGVALPVGGGGARGGGAGVAVCVRTGWLGIASARHGLLNLLEGAARARLAGCGPLVWPASWWRDQACLNEIQARHASAAKRFPMYAFGLSEWMSVTVGPPKSQRYEPGESPQRAPASQVARDSRTRTPQRSRGTLPKPTSQTRRCAKLGDTTKRRGPL